MLEENKEFIDKIKVLNDIEYIFLNEKYDMSYFTILMSVKNIETEDKIVKEIVKLIRRTERLIDFIIYPLMKRNIKEFIPVDSELIYSK